MRPLESISKTTRTPEAFESAWHQRFVEFATLNDDDAGIAGWSLSGLETRLRFFRHHWRAPGASDLYLDVGCGAGTYARWLAEQGVRVIGIDYSIPTLIKARRRAPEAVAFCAGNALRLPFRRATFDGALCFGLLQAVSDSRSVVFELARVLKPGAELWIDALNQDAFAARVERVRRRWRGKGMHLRYESPVHLDAILTDAGFGELVRHWLPIVPARLLRIQSLAESRIARSALASIPLVGAFLSHAFVFRARRFA